MREQEIYFQNPSGEPIGEKTKKIGKEVVKWRNRLDWGVLIAGGAAVGIGVVVPFLSGLALAAGVDIGKNNFVKDRVLADQKKEMLPVGQS